MLTLALTLALIGLNADHKSLVNSARYDEAIEIRHLCKFNGEFFFYQAIAYYQLKQYDLAKRNIEQAFFYKDLPERYSVVLTLLIDELQRIKDNPDKILDISTDMRIIQERLQNAKGGNKTQKLQRDVIKKLDEQIKAAEDEIAKASESNSTQNGTQAKLPSSDSRPSSNSPPKGDISNRKLIQTNESWGRLPKKEAIKATEELNKILPPHIREAVEGFSKKLQQGNQRKKE